MLRLKFKKLITSVYWAIIFGLIIGIYRAVAFYISDSYTRFELDKVGLYLIQHQVLISVSWTLLACLVFFVIWSLYDRFEGVAIAGFIVLAVMIPIAKFVNEAYLPGIRDIKSIIGNSAMMLFSLLAFILLYLKLFRHLRLLQRLYSGIILIFCLLLLVAVNVAYFIQPSYSRLEKSSKNYDPSFNKLFDFKSATDSLTSKDLSVEQFLARVSAKHDSVKQELLDKIDLYYDDRNDAIINAEKIINREFTLWSVTKTLPDTIDWYDNVTGDEVWLYALDEFEWMMHIMYAHILTNDEEYAAEFQKIMTNFFDRVNPIDWKNEEDPVWRLIGVGLRLSDSWVDAFYIFLNSPGVSRDLKIKMLGYIHDQAQFLYHFRSPRWNHLIQESYGLMKVGIMFPEFKMSKAWLEMAHYRLDRAVTIDVYPDGGYNEASTFYHRYVIRLFQMIMEYAERHGVHLSDNFYAKFEKMYEFLMYTAWPDGRMPAVNDGFHAIEQRNLFPKPAERFNRPDFKFFATDGREGTEPDITSMAFPYTGLYVMRSDWTKNARYCIFDGGLFGSAHGHEDKLNFEIFAYGQPFIIESGTYTYVYNDWHKYFESSFAHNTIVVDGRSQLRHAYPDEWISEPHTEQSNVWISNDDFDYVAASYDKGYRDYKEQSPVEIKHTRRMVFIKPDYWILWDVLAGKGEHKFEQQFHFYPLPINISDSTKTTVTQKPGGPNLLLHPLITKGVTVKKATGADEPIQGWYSPKYGEKQPAPTVIYTLERKSPVTFADVLYPFQNNADGESIKISEIKVQTVNKILDDSEAIAVKIENANWTDLILLAPGNKETKRFENIITSSEFCFHRLNKDGFKIKEVESKL